MSDKKQEMIQVTRDGQSREFTKEVWDKLPDNKYGWKKKADKPDEVKKLEGSKSATSETGTGTGAGTGTGSDTGNEGTPEKAADLAKKIFAAETAKDVDALVSDGETRRTVLDAATARKEQLKK